MATFSPTRRRILSNEFSRGSMDYSGHGSSTAIELDMNRLSEQPLVDKSDPIGLPAKKSIVTWKDLTAIFICYACLAGALASVFDQKFAVWLGQTAQLQVVGVLLTVMALCTQRQVRLVALLVEARFGRSSLQDYDYIIRNELFSKEISFAPRMILLVLLSVPLVLSILYKSFSNGNSAVGIDSTSTNFGLFAAPGEPFTGIGLSLAANAYVPFWANPILNTTYGYNLFAASDQVSALLDTPDPDYVVPLQASLRLGDSVTLNTTVNATVSEYLDISADRGDLTYWSDIENSKNYGLNSLDLSNDTWAALLTPVAGARTVYVGLFNAPSGGNLSMSAFYENAKAYNQTRRLCRGIWNITSDKIELIGASLLQDANEAEQNDQTLVEKVSLVMYNWFTNLIPEFNYLWFPRNSTMDTLPPLVASMTWGRNIAHNGPQTPIPNNDVPIVPALVKYSKAAADIVMMKQSLTLKRSWGLITILAIQPLLTTLAVIFKMTMYSVPIGDNFGLVSMLSGMRHQRLDLLEGAGLTGTLSRSVPVHFETASWENGGKEQSVIVALDVHGFPQYLEKGVVYG